MITKTILGESRAVQDLIKMIKQVAHAKTNILIIGESGTGKELVARMIHDSGPFKDLPFVAVNCGAIPENLIESEFFGHKKGSFTGAVNDKIGLFEAAQGGTIFLDEVGELPFALQVKLLRAIQERRIRKVGDVSDISIDVRIIAATNRDLEMAVKQGTFREDLYYRLNVILIKTPPLREREGDVQILTEHFYKKFAEKNKKNILGLDPEALSAINSYFWPGNIRELENSIDRAVTLETSHLITLPSLPLSIQKAFSNRKEGPNVSQKIEIPLADFSSGKIILDEILFSVEKKYIDAALEHTRGNKKSAADLLGISFKSLSQRLEKIELKK